MTPGPPPDPRCCSHPDVEAVIGLMDLGWPQPLASLAVWDREEWNRRLAENALR